MPPKQPGTYALLMQLARGAPIDVGQLGRFHFPAGWYIYVGSARGPGGLAARVARHRRSSKRLHWHVDYLRIHARPALVWYAVGDRRRECAWVQALSQLRSASIPVHGFGASDCRCPAHLVHFGSRPRLSAFAHQIDDHIAEEILQT